MPAPNAAFLGCDINKLLSKSSCFLNGCIGEEGRAAVDLYLRIASLASYGGTDYSNGLSAVNGLGKLLVDSKAWNGVNILNPTNRQAVALYIDYLDAVANGVTALSTNALIAKGQSYRRLDASTKRNLLVFLKCQLNALDQPG